VRAGYAAEARRIVSQLKQTGISRIAVFYQDDGLGKTLLGELRNASAAENVPFTAEIKLDPKQPDFSAAAAATLKAQPQAVILATAGTTLTSYVSAVLETTTRPGFYGFSVASQDVIKRELKEQARGIVLAQIMPSLRNTSVPVVVEYLKLLRERSGEAVPSASQFEGFVHAKLLVVGLRRAGPKLTTDSFIKAMESAGDIGFGRFIARYTPQSHVGSTYVELAIMDKLGQLRY
jgi:ABC-type branched-subunit amino acid transport system substrate-binding protein